MPTRATWLALALAAAACGSDHDDAASPPPVVCADLQQATADGQCVTIGVDSCSPGFVADGRGGCDAIVPAEPCPDGTRAALGKTTCESVGVGMCGIGFESDGAGGCRAIMPKLACTAGLIAIPGDTSCREVMPCGTGTWGAIPVDGATVFVDAGYLGTDSDGTRARPFKTINAAVAKGGSTIVVAAGKYPENVTLSGSARLLGRCPSLVEVQGVTAAAAIVASGTATISGIAVTGASEAIYVPSGTVTVEKVWVHDTVGDGVYVAGATSTVTIRETLIENVTTAGITARGGTAIVDGAAVRNTKSSSDRLRGHGAIGWSNGKLTITRSLFEKSHEAGVVLLGATGVVEDTLIRDTLPNGNGQEGTGLGSVFDASARRASQLTVRRSVVERSTKLGLSAEGSVAVVEDTTIVDTQPEAGTKNFGRGIIAIVQQKTKKVADVTVRRSLIARNHDTGVAVFGSKLTMEQSIVADTKPQLRDGLSGTGLLAQVDPETKVASEAAITQSLFARNSAIAIGFLGSTGVIEDCVVRDTLPQKSNGEYGHAIAVDVSRENDGASSVLVRRTLIERAHAAGIFASGSTLTVEDSLVRNILPRLRDGRTGHGISAQADTKSGLRSQLELRGSVVEHTVEDGVSVFGSVGTIERTVVRDIVQTEPELLFGRGIDAIVDPGTFGGCELTVRQSLVERAVESGIGGYGSILRVDRTLIRDVASSGADGRFGDGLAILREAIAPDLPTSLELTLSRVERSARAGVFVIGGALHMSQTTFVCSAIDVDVEPFEGIASTLSDGGGNSCGCDKRTSCRAQTTNLAPLPPTAKPG